MKKVIIFLLLFFSINRVYALQECTPSDEYIKYMNLSDEEKVNYVEPPYCKNIMYEAVKEEKEGFFSSIWTGLKNLIFSSSSDSAYNAYTSGLVTPPKNQGDLGTCWSFSTISTVETNAKKNGLSEYDFSEQHMLQSVLAAAYSDNAGKSGKYITQGFSGGKVTYAASYFFNGIGQLLESELPYANNEIKINSSNYKPGRKIISVGGFGFANIGDYSVCGSDEISYIKNRIINYGSVQSSMYMDERLFSDSHKDYYLSRLSDSDKGLPNHGIAIVGWDDNISKSNFNGATRNGAFIIKNSWGTSWSDDGFFYISYDDHFICKNTTSFYGVSDKTYDYTYTSADMVGDPAFMFPGTFYTSSKFTKKISSNESLERVSFATAPNSNYSIYLSATNNLNNDNSWYLLGSGRSTEYGISSIDINDIEIDDDFTIIVKYVPDSKSSIFAMCNNAHSHDTDEMEYSQNTNFYSQNGSDWYDMYSIPVESKIIKCEPNIFVYTNKVNTSGASTSGNITINSVGNTNDVITIGFTNNNVSTDTISYKVLNENSANVTSHFTIRPNYSTNKVVVTSDGTVSGRFKFVITYVSDEITASTNTTFQLTESVSSNDSSFVSVGTDNITINLNSYNTFTYQMLLNTLKVRNTSIIVTNPNGKNLSSSDSITTNSKIKFNSKTYNAVVTGDVNCDGTISALDYIDIRKHIMGTTINDGGRRQAADLDGNAKISALDYIAIRKILMR